MTLLKFALNQIMLLKKSLVQSVINHHLFAPTFALVKMIKRGKQPLKTALNAWVLWRGQAIKQAIVYSDFGNQFLPFGSPARKISIIRCKCTANSLKKTSEQCVGFWRMVNMSTSRWCLTPWIDESHFQNSFPPLFPKDESACGMFCNWCFAFI